tara:strand:- start:22 stop:246 length:225 start_codon:yes stop_codon:yes gene_type:complete
LARYVVIGNTFTVIDFFTCHWMNVGSVKGYNNIHEKTRINNMIRNCHPIISKKQRAKGEFQGKEETVVDSEQDD